MTLDRRDIRIYLAVHRYGSIRAASDQLGLAPSVVSRQIADLEAQLGVTLFERSSKGVRLTDAGNLVLEHARHVVEEAGFLQEQLADLRGIQQRNIRIHCGEGFLADFIRNGLAGFVSHSPHVRYELLIGSTDTVVAALWQHDGFVLEFQGDSVIGVWPPGFSGKDHALKAVAAARSMARTLARQEDAGDDPIRAGIGLHTGTAFLCTFSAASGLLQEVGAFGQAMNIAARLSALAEPGQILATRAVCDAARQAPPPLRQVTLKGIDEPVEITALA